MHDRAGTGMREGGREGGSERVGRGESERERERERERDDSYSLSGLLLGLGFREVILQLLMVSLELLQTALLFLQF